MILFGHPTGNPNSHHAALAHQERNRLAAFCVPWMPSARVLDAMEKLPPIREQARRLRKRQFPPLAGCTLIQGRAGEFSRLLRRYAAGGRFAGDHLAYEANDWLMHTMARHCARADVTAVHAYEDCSQLSFEAAKKLGKHCIYDMPIGYYRAWQETEERLLRDYADWLPDARSDARLLTRPHQKEREMELADLVLAPSSFVRDTITRHTGKTVKLAPYGVDHGTWRPGETPPPPEPIVFLFVGQLSIRKGIPTLFKAWEKAALPDARLLLAGTWRMDDSKRRELPANVEYLGQLSRDELRNAYQNAHVMVLPSYFEGYALVIAEAMASGLPVLASDSTGGQDIIDTTCGRIYPTWDFDALVESLRHFSNHRDALPAMREAAIAKAATATWENYRRAVQRATDTLPGA